MSERKYPSCDEEIEEEDENEYYNRMQYMSRSNYEYFRDIIEPEYTSEERAVQEKAVNLQLYALYRNYRETLATMKRLSWWSTSNGNEDWNVLMDALNVLEHFAGYDGDSDNCDSYEEDLEEEQQHSRKIESVDGLENWL